MECENIIEILQSKGIKLIPPKDLPKDELIYSLLDTLTEVNIIGRNVLRDIKIRAQYTMLKESGKSSPEARQIIIDQSFTDQNGNKYYISEDTVRNILYSKKRRK
jgi:hypothetical protein